MEVSAGFPPPGTIRSLILNSQIKEPIVFRKIHNDWNPVKWDIGKLGSVFAQEDKLLPCRVGKVNVKSQEPQWESQTRIKCISWSTLSSWNSPDEWVYYDYKNMTDIVDPKYLSDFEWSRLGFPERNGELSNVWVGSSNSYTPCHFDTYGCNLVSQIKGRKQWLLLPPEETPNLYPSRIPYEESSIYSQINFDKPSFSYLQVLKKVKGLVAVLEPGDVLFVPPFWWHFVKSQEFSISVNTWVELPEDKLMRVQEAVVKSIIGSFVSICSAESAIRLLNPNEEELLELNENQIVDILQSSSSMAFLNHKPDIDLDETEPSTKKTKFSETIQRHSGVNAMDILKECVTVTSLAPFNPTSFYSDMNYEENNQTPEDPSSPNLLEHLINAVAHPSIVKAITKQFLENVRFQTSKPGEF